MSPFPYTFPFAFEPVSITTRVRIAFASDPFDASPSWDDVSSDVMEFHIRRGRQHELDRMEAGTAVIVLKNTSGNYYSNNAGGSYYPNVKTMKRVNIQMTFDGGTTYNDLFTGYVESWKPAWKLAGLKGAYMLVQCVDALKAISRLYLNSAGYAQELSGTRVGNVLDDLSWAAGDRNIDVGQHNMAATGALSNVNALDHLQQVQTSELGVLYVTPGGIITFEDRSHRNASPHDTAQAIFGDDSPEDPYSNVEFDLDETLLYNEVRAQRTGGTEQTLENSTSQTTYGKRSLVKSSLLLTNDTEVKLHAHYLIARFSDTETRVKSIDIIPDANQANLYPKVLGFDISDRIKVRLNEASIDDDYFIEGVQHDWYANGNPPFVTRWQLSDATRYLYPPDAVEDILRPNGNSSINLSTQFPASGNHYDKVDEVTSDGDTTYVAAIAVENNYDLYTLDNAPYRSGVVNSVTVHFLAKEASGIAGSAWSVIYTNVTLYTGSVKSLGASYAEYTEVYNTNPNTGNAWTWDEIDALQAGIGLEGVSGTEARCTQVYVTVNYTPAW